MDADRLKKMPYEIKFISKLEYLEDPMDSNIDVRVLLENGEGYIATLYTPKNIQNIMDKRVDFEIDDSKYFYDRSMLIVSRLDMDHVETAVRCLIKRGELLRCFEKEGSETQND